MKTDKLLQLIQQKTSKRSGGALPLPKAQGGYPVPTRADSLMLYNNALDKIKFYQNNPDYNKQKGIVDFKNPNVRKNLIKLSSSIPHRTIEDFLINSMINSKIRDGKPFTAKELHDIKKTKGQQRFGRVPGTNLTSFGDIVEDSTKSNPSVGTYDEWFNPLAPPIYLHPNIAPQGSNQYYSRTFGDLSDVPHYDPLAVKPEDMLTDAERIERAKKYPGSLKNPLHDVEYIDHAPVRTFKDMLPELATEKEELKPTSKTPLYVPEKVRRVMNPAFDYNTDFLPNRTKEAVVDSLGNPRYKYYDGDKVITQQEYNKLMQKKQSGGSTNCGEGKYWDENLKRCIPRNNPFLEYNIQDAYDYAKKYNLELDDESKKYIDQHYALGINRLPDSYKTGELDQEGHPIWNDIPFIKKMNDLASKNLGVSDWNQELCPCSNHAPGSRAKNSKYTPEYKQRIATMMQKDPEATKYFLAKCGCFRGEDKNFPKESTIDNPEYIDRLKSKLKKEFDNPVSNSFHYKNEDERDQAEDYYQEKFDKEGKGWIKDKDGYEEQNPEIRELRYNTTDRYTKDMVDDEGNVRDEYARKYYEEDNDENPGKKELADIVTNAYYNAQPATRYLQVKQEGTSDKPWENKYFVSQQGEGIVSDKGLKKWNPVTSRFASPNEVGEWRTIGFDEYQRLKEQEDPKGMVTYQEFKKGGPLPKAQAGYEQAKAQYVKASAMGPMGEYQMQQLVKQYPQLANDASLTGQRSVGNAAMYRNKEEANRVVTNTLGQVISTPASRLKAQREEIIARRPEVYNVQDYKMGIQEPGAPNDITDDPIAMAILATATGGVGLEARGLGTLATDFAGNLASEATFGGYDFAHSGFKLNKNLFPSKETINTVKQGIKDFRSNPKLAVAKWKYPAGTLEGDYIRHFQTSKLPQTIKDGKIKSYLGINDGQSIYNDNLAAATNLNNTLATRITDLQSQEGFGRLVNEEADHLRSIGFNKSTLANTPFSNVLANMTDDQAIQYMAEYNANHALQRMRNVHNVNEGILNEVRATMQTNPNFNNKDLQDILNKHGYPIYNATANSGGKIIPPFITLGYGYGDSVPTIEHEIIHILQHNREMPIDKQLKFLEVADNLTPDQQQEYDYFINGKKENTAPGRSREPAPFLAEIRQLMKEQGFIQNTYDPVTPEMMEQAYEFFKKNPQFRHFNSPLTGVEFRSDHRIFDFMKPSKTNFNLLSSLMNKLPVVAGVGLVGAGAIDAATGDQSQGEQKQKKGGLVRAQKGLNLSHGFSWKDVESARNSAAQKQREEKQQEGLWAQRDNTKQNYRVDGSNKYTPELTPLQIADEVTDIMQMGHFIPLPPAQWIGLAGDIIGAPIDGWQAGEALAKGNYDDMTTNIALAVSGAILGKKGYRRDMWGTAPGSFANTIARLGSREGTYIPLTAPARLISNPVINRGINLNRGLLLNQGLETIYDSQYGEPTDNTQPAESSYTNFFGPKKELLPDEEWALAQGYDLETWRALPTLAKTKLMMNPKDKSMDFSLRMKPTSTVLKGKKKPNAFDIGGPTPKKAAQMLKDNSAHGQPLTDAQRRYFQLLINQKNKK